MNITESDLSVALDNIRNLHEEMTPLVFSPELSARYNCPIYLKIESQAPIWSYKWRGAWNMMALLDESARRVWVICSSAWNHAQWVALSSRKLGIQATIVMPQTAPSTKIQKTQRLWWDLVDIILHGDTYDDAYTFARSEEKNTGKVFVHPFDDTSVISGQATVALEIFEQMKEFDTQVWMILAANGGWGLLAWIHRASILQKKDIQIVWVEPENAASMSAALKAGKPIKISVKNTVADGAKVGQVGKIGFETVRDYNIPIIQSPEWRLCTTIMEMHQEYIVLEWAGALWVDGLKSLSQDDFETLRKQNKAIVVVLWWWNIDLAAYHGIVEKSLRYQGLRKDYTITFPQRPGALAEFTSLLVPFGINISHIHYDEKAANIEGAVQVTLDTRDTKNFLELEKRFYETWFLFHDSTNNYANAA